MPKEEKEDSEEQGIIGKLKKLVMPETEKREEVSTGEMEKRGEETGTREVRVTEERIREGVPVETKTREVKIGEIKAGEMRPSEERPGEMRPSEMRATEPEHAAEGGKPYTYEFYHEIGKRGGEERAREIREEGISPEVHEKLSAAGKKGGPRGGEATKRKHGHESLEEHRKEHGE